MTDTAKTTETRSLDLRVRVNAEEIAMMDAICDRDGQPRLSRSQALRWALRELAEKLDVVG